MKNSKIILIMLSSCLFLNSAYIYAFDRAEKALGVAAISGLIAGYANYYYKMQQVSQSVAELASGNLEQKKLNQKKDAQKKALKSAIITGLIAAGCMGIGAYQFFAEADDAADNDVNYLKEVVANQPAVQGDKKDIIFDHSIVVVPLKKQYEGKIYKITAKAAGVLNLAKFLPGLKERIAAFVDNLTVPYETDHLVVYEETGKTNFVSDVVKKYTVVNADTLDYAKIMIYQGLDPAVLDMANEFHPGGGPERACGAQEEQCCYRSNLFAPLYYARKLVPTKRHYHEKAFIPAQGAIYVPRVTVTKASEAQNYRALLKSEQYQVAFIASAACNLRKGNLGASYATNDKTKDEYTHLMKEKIRSQIRIALLHRHDSLLLSAFGCGAFENDPAVVADMYRDILNEEEFARAPFKSIVFAIYTGRDGSNANFEQFKKAFNVP